MKPHEEASGISSTLARTKSRVRASFELAQIIELDNAGIGLLKVLREPGQWTLLQLQLLPDYQGRGTGTGILLNLIDEATASGATISLHVLRSNRAKHLYEQLGFVTIGVSKNGFAMSNRQ